MTTEDPIAEALQRLVDTGQMAGAATLVWRDGRVAQSAAVGWRDIAAGLPIERDTPFRIASASKPITSTAALMLYDEGRFELEDPIARWAPEFAEMRVLRAPDAALDDTVPAERPITFADLLTHRSGLTYGAFHPGPLADAYYAALGADIDSAVAPDDWIAGLASLPLIDQPGAGFHYGVSTDLLGLLVARIDGAPLAQVLERRIFSRLGMKDTGFTLSPDAWRRRARMYGFDEAGRLVERPAHPPERPAFLAERPAGTTFFGGGAGLWSTLDDYLAFARMFVEEGAVDGVRLLKVGTLRRMTANFLTERQRVETRILGSAPFAGHGFGLGVAVVLDPDKADPMRCKGGIGTVGWPGAFGCWWQADPTDGSVMIFMAQNALDMDRLAQGFGLGAFEAQVTFHAMASA